jgi:hypothetical protein
MMLVPDAAIDDLLICRKRGASQAFGGEAPLGVVGNPVDREESPSGPGRQIKQHLQRDSLNLGRTPVLDGGGRPKAGDRSFVEVRGNGSARHRGSFSF